MGSKSASTALLRAASLLGLFPGVLDRQFCVPFRLKGLSFALSFSSFNYSPLQPLLYSYVIKIYLLEEEASKGRRRDAK